MFAMKKIIAGIVFIGILLTLNACVVVTNPPDAYPQSHSHTTFDHWYYYPNSQVYYHISEHYFYYLDGVRWRKARSLPEDWVLNNDHRAQIKIKGKPYLKHSHHKRKYPAIRHTNHSDFDNWFYYPDSQVYFHTKDGYYYYLDDRKWRRADRLPRDWVLNHDHRVRIKFGDKPYLRHSHHKRKYPADRHRHERDDRRRHDYARHDNDRRNRDRDDHRRNNNKRSDQGQYARDNHLGPSGHDRQKELREQKRNPTVPHTKERRVSKNPEPTGKRAPKKWSDKNFIRDLKQKTASGRPTMKSDDSKDTRRRDTGKTDKFVKRDGSKKSTLAEEIKNRKLKKKLQQSESKAKQASEKGKRKRKEIAKGPHKGKKERRDQDYGKQANKNQNGDEEEIELKEGKEKRSGHNADKEEDKLKKRKGKRWDS